jgi:transcriptional regulator with GAF, ATPase, and Fis domain
MSDVSWLPANECPLLRPEAEADARALRLVQRLLEILTTPLGSDILARALLEEIGSALHGDFVAVVEAPRWQSAWQYLSPGSRAPRTLPTSLLSDVLDREAGTRQPVTATAPAYLAVVLSYTERANRVLLIARPREAFRQDELEYAVAAGHYLGAGLERARAWDEQTAAVERLEALVIIARQLAEQRETLPLLEHITGQAAQLLRCERASLFLWDKARKELVARPALGLPNNELRVPEDTGIVGRVIQTGEPCQVDAVAEDLAWSANVDKESGFRTRNLLAVPLVDGAGERLGVLEALNKKQGRFTPQDTQTLTALAAHAVAAIENVREREELMRTNAQNEGQARLGARIVGESTAMKALRDTVERVARTDLPVLILGESGSGKEVVARATHHGSPRHSRPFLPVNCAAIAESLLESELFGHEKGAFTGADSVRQGKFELAIGGTLFLDEIGDMSAGGQAKLLRVLEEKTVVRVGGSHPIAVDVRIVAATNRQLAEAVRAGKFRQDLYYRLTVVTIDLPPLRERRDDVVPLAEFFLEQFGRDAGRRRLKLSAEAKRRLQEHDWPGNVRELRNLMERVAFLSPNEKVEASDLVFILKPPTGEAADPFANLTLKDATEAFEEKHIRGAIERAGRNMTEAARLLGVQRTNLYRKMRMLGMELP